MTVMPGLDPGIHVFLLSQNVDGRVKPGHDKARTVRRPPYFRSLKFTLRL